MLSDVRQATMAQETLTEKWKPMRMIRLGAISESRATGLVCPQTKSKLPFTNVKIEMEIHRMCTVYLHFYLNLIMPQQSLPQQP